MRTAETNSTLDAVHSGEEHTSAPWFDVDTLDRPQLRSELMRAKLRAYGEFYRVVAHLLGQSGASDRIQSEAYSFSIRKDKRFSAAHGPQAQPASIPHGWLFSRRTIQISFSKKPPPG